MIRALDWDRERGYTISTLKSIFASTIGGAINIQPREGVKPISDFRRDSARVLKLLHERREPILLTQRGRSVAVLLDIETYERLEYDSGLRASYLRGVADLERGRSRPHEEVAKEVLGRLGA